MRRLLIALGVFACACTLVAQSSTASKSGHSATASSSASATPTEVKDLPVRKVVLYKNGVGFFEHAGTVTGNQRVSIDFTSSQLNDVLQSLTVLDEGGGRVGGVNYNSTTPLSEQLKSLSLGMGDNPTSTELFQALRGQRVEVTGAPGGAITGRLMSIESRDERLSGSSDSDATIQKNFLTLVASSGAARVIELTPVVSVRPLDAGLQLQLDRYLELLATTHAHGLRHLTLNAMGSGVRTLRVSYISEVPVWKSTYRIVFPRDSNDKAIVQGWAVVDNTVGADWDNVQLSLVAGAPQSFIQPLSQPLYTRRPVIPIAVAANTTPQTHEAADFAGGGTISGIVTDASGAVISGASVTVTSTSTGASLSGQSGNDGRFTIGSLEPGTYNLSVSMPGFQRYMMSSINVDEARSAVENVTLQVGASAETVMVSAAPPPEPVALASNKAMRGIGFGGGLVAGAGSGYGGGVYRPSDAISQGDVSTSAFDDYFEYALTQPVTIHKNESAMVPILQQEVPAQHVTLWSERQPHPLRAVWLTNDSKLTLDSGSFSIFENGEFAGEGLLDPIHPGERRLLSYANDQAIRVKVIDRDSRRNLHHVAIRKGVIIETRMDTDAVTYSASNTAETDRNVLIEMPRRTNGWSLDDGMKADETTPDLYRFRLPVAAHQTAKLEVRQHGPESTSVTLNPEQDYRVFLLDLVKRVPDAKEQLEPVIEAEGTIADLDRRITESKQQEQTAIADEARARENVTALKGNDAGKRFVDELNRAEDTLQSTRKQIADLQTQRKAAVDKLNQLISNLSFDWDVKPQS